MEYLRIRNWSKHQTIAGRKAPFVTIQTSILLDMEYMCLPDRERLCFLLLLAFAGTSTNKIPASACHIMHLCHFDDEPNIELMIERGLLEPWSDKKHKELIDNNEKRLKDQRERQKKSRDNKVSHKGVTDLSRVTEPMSHVETETETETETDKEQPTTTPKRKRGTRLPDDWIPTQELKDWASLERPDLKLEKTIDSFCDYWHSKPGKDGRRIAWDLVFKNWIRNERHGNRKEFIKSISTPQSRNREAIENHRRQNHAAAMVLDA